MYDELVKRLRELQTITEHCDEQSCDECENRELCDKHDNKTLSGTYKEAADAIEELQAAEKKYLANISALETENQHLKREREWMPVASTRDFNTVKSDLMRHLFLSCQKTDGEILWYDGTIEVLVEFLSILNQKAEEGE